jgi:hypothetical protein
VRQQQRPPLQQEQEGATGRAGRGDAAAAPTAGAVLARAETAPGTAGSEAGVAAPVPREPLTDRSRTVGPRTKEEGEAGARRKPSTWRPAPAAGRRRDAHQAQGPAPSALPDKTTEKEEGVAADLDLGLGLEKEKKRDNGG